MNNREQILHFYLMGWDDCVDQNQTNINYFGDSSVFSKAYRFGWMDCKDGGESRVDNSDNEELIKMILSDD